jgi:hypothetical protein
MKEIVADRPFADADAAARKLVEIASDLRASVRSLNLTCPMVLHIAAEKIVEGRPNNDNRSLLAYRIPCRGHSRRQNVCAELKLQCDGQRTLSEMVFLKMKPTWSDAAA